MPRSRHLLSKLLLAAAAVLTPVMTLANAPPQPNPMKSSDGPPWVGFLFMGVLLAVVLGVSLMPTKRGHQD